MRKHIPISKFVVGLVLGALLFWGSVAVAQQTPTVTTMQNAATATGNGTPLSVAGPAANPANVIGAAGVQVTGTFSGTVTFETTTNGSTWTSVMATNLADDTRATTTTAPGQFTIILGSAVQVRARVSAYTSGSITVVGRLVPGLVARVSSSGGGGSGTVTSVAQSFTGGLISVSGSPVTSSGTLALTVAGTSGGIPYFSSSSTWASSGALAANALVIGGGAGVAPSTTTTGTGVLTALGVNTGSTGAFVLFDGALGTPSSGTLTNATGLPISSGVSGLGTGVATALAVNTGSLGAFVVNGGALGTPSSGTLTNATGLPIASGVSGLGTGVATALAVNVGSAGAPVLFDGAGGTPSSIDLTNGLNLPLSTGVTGDLPFANFVQAPSAGFVGATASGDYSHRTPTQVTAALDAFVGDSGSGGTKGLVPAPASGDAAANKFLKADGTWATAGGGGTPGGSNTQLQYNNSSNFGGISGATSDGTNLTTTSGSLRATSPRITTSIFDANGLAIISLNPTASAVNSLQVTNGATGSPGVVDLAAIGSDSDVRLTLTPKGVAGVRVTSGVTTGSGSTAGFQVAVDSLTTGAGASFASSSVTSGNVVSMASTSTAAASNTQTVLNVATSGANGTSTQTTYGAQFANTHTGTSSTNVGLQAAASGGSTNWALSIGDGSQSTQSITANLSGANDPNLLFGNASFQFNPANTGVTYYLGNTHAVYGSGMDVGWSSTSSASGGSNDTAFNRAAAGVVKVGGGSAGANAGTFSTPALSPAQITADQNNYAPGTGWFQRWSSDASRNVTGLAAGVDGQIVEIWNVGSNNIVLQNENASSTAANRFATSTGADLTLSAGKCAKARYDTTSARWRAYLCN